MESSGRVLLASQRESQNIHNKLAQPSSAGTLACTEHKHTAPGSPTKAATPRQQGSTDKENMQARPVKVSAIPTRLQQHASSEPTVAQLLAQSPAHMHTRSVVNGEGRDSPSNGNGNGTAIASWRKGQGFKAWETELLKSAEVRRKADMAQLCTLHSMRVR